jgi:membrane-associated protease RseP (regulator of RpoE activity)
MNPSTGKKFFMGAVVLVFCGMLAVLIVIALIAADEHEELVDTARSVMFTQPMELGGNWLGIRVTSTDSPTAAKMGIPASTKGVLVSELAERNGMRARQAGISPGDVITAVDGKPVSDIADLYDISRNQDVGAPLLIDVQRWGQPMTLVMPAAYQPPMMGAAPDDPTRGSAGGVYPGLRLQSGIWATNGRRHGHGARHGTRHGTRSAASLSEGESVLRPVPGRAGRGVSEVRSGVDGSTVIMKKIFRHWQSFPLVVPVIIGAFAMAGGGIGDAKWMGITVDTLSRSEAAELRVPANAGAVVVVKVGEPAISCGVIVGDVIVGMNSVPIKSIDDFLEQARRAMANRGPDGLLSDTVLSVNRLGRLVTITIPAEWMEGAIRR